MSDTWNEDTEDTDGDRLVETPDSLRDEDPETPSGDRGAGAEDRPLGAEKFGTTHAEAEQGESLDQRLAEEVPDGDGHDPVDDTVLADEYGHPDASDDRVGDDSVGRVVAPDEGAHGDDEKDEVASDVGRDGGDLTAEEAALHLDPDS